MSRNTWLGYYDHIALKFARHLGAVDAKVLVTFQTEYMVVKSLVKHEIPATKTSVFFFWSRDSNNTSVLFIMAQYTV